MPRLELSHPFPEVMTLVQGALGHYFWLLWARLPVPTDQLPLVCSLSLPVSLIECGPAWVSPRWLCSGLVSQVSAFWGNPGPWTFMPVLQSQQAVLAWLLWLFFCPAPLCCPLPSLPDLHYSMCRPWCGQCPDSICGGTIPGTNSGGNARTLSWSPNTCLSSGSSFSPLPSGSGPVGVLLPASIAPADWITAWPPGSGLI